MPDLGLDSLFPPTHFRTSDLDHTRLCPSAVVWLSTNKVASRRYKLHPKLLYGDYSISARPGNPPSPRGYCILLALEPQPGRARHVRKVIIELSSRCSERYMDFLEQVQVHITELVIQHPGSEMSPRPNLSENSAAEVYFFQDITLRSFTFTQLVSLRLTVHYDAMPNTARFLSLCPQLSQLCLECPTAVLEGQFGFAVDASFLLEKLESLDIAARGLNSLAWLVMLKTLAPNLKRASLRKVKHIPEVTSRDFKRAREISSPITKSIMGLTSLEWGLDPARIEDICPAGMEQSLTSFTTASTSHTAAMDRLEVSTGSSYRRVKEELAHFNTSSYEFHLPPSFSAYT